MWRGGPPIAFVLLLLGRPVVFASSALRWSRCGGAGPTSVPTISEERLWCDNRSRPVSSPLFAERNLNGRPNTSHSSRPHQTRAQARYHLRRLRQGRPPHRQDPQLRAPLQPRRGSPLEAPARRRAGSTPRQILAGIRKSYTAEQLIGKTIIIVANLEPKDIRGEQSRGMLLAASDAPKEGAPPERRVVILTTLSEMPPGSIVS